MHKNIFFASLIAVSVMLSGCSFYNRGYQIVTVTTDPDDATVIANGIQYPSRSPQFIETRTGREFLLSVYKPGYKESLYVVDYQLSSTGKIDAWSSILIFPMFGLFSNGAWELKENNIKIKLEPLPQEPAMENAKNKAAEERKKIIEEINHMQAPVAPAAVEAAPADSTAAPAAQPAAAPATPVTSSATAPKPIVASPVVSVNQVPTGAVTPVVVPTKAEATPAEPVAETQVPAKAVKVAKAIKAKDDRDDQKLMQEVQSAGVTPAGIPAAHAADAASIVAGQQQ